jgi:hypothetical protein
LTSGRFLHISLTLAKLNLTSIAQRDDGGAEAAERAGFTWWRGRGTVAVDSHRTCCLCRMRLMSLPSWIVVAVTLTVALVGYLPRRIAPEICLGAVAAPARLRSIGADERRAEADLAARMAAALLAVACDREGMASAVER